MKRPTLDRRALSLLIAVWLAVTQFLSVGHLVDHAPGLAAWTAHAVSHATIDAHVDGHGHGGSHAAGDTTCLALAHLLSSGPPGATTTSFPIFGLDPVAGWQASDRPVSSQAWSPSLPRAPPVLIGLA